MNEGERKVNPYDCSTCDNEDCSGCGTHAYEAGIKEVVENKPRYYISEGTR